MEKQTFSRRSASCVLPKNLTPAPQDNNINKNYNKKYSDSRLYFY